MLIEIDMPSGFHGEAGFTLIEMLVSMVTALLITLAAFALLQVVVDQSSRETDYLQASQLGDTAIAHITDELHSGCFATGLKPIFANSSGTDLIFATAYSEKTEPTAAQAQKHEIKWEAEPKAAGKVLETGKLVDYMYAGKGTYPSFTFAASPSYTKKTILAQHVATNSAAGESTIFKYYKYSAEAQQSSESTVGSFTPLAATPTLTAAEAEQTASVVVSFRQLPSDGSEKPGRSLDLKSQVTFAFGAPIAEPKIVDKPCE